MTTTIKGISFYTFYAMIVWAMVFITFLITSDIWASVSVLTPILFIGTMVLELSLNVDALRQDMEKKRLKECRSR